MDLLAVSGADVMQVGIRWVHILAAIAAGGAVIVKLTAVSPVLATLPDEERWSLSTRIADKWRPIVFTLIAALLLTGLLNFFLYQIPAFKPHPQKMVYHGLFGVKFLAALAFFHGAAVLSLPGPKGEKYRAKARGWLSYMFVLLLVIVTCAVVMRYFPVLFPAGIPVSE
ncbi:MAG: hypothetical protein AB7N71_09295 [Phycisphaerae bacterium]